MLLNATKVNVEIAHCRTKKSTSCQEYHSVRVPVAEHTAYIKGLGFRVPLK